MSGEYVRAHIRRGHIPFETWCQECMMGRGQEDPHRARDPNASATPVVSFDYGFLSLGEDGS
eukprot:1678741-Pyramimonas_sp.AAC.1